ncbi:unnamed protein product [Protopolystoma xenopodis]|uniref:Uncharacterized protein n=1 Tax=Protopolystoma xenopodis TaxID=117903 RepID=A0A3S5BAL4_9PLAT|nr:unnamed protein product [Protopolystoma xenopodis]
MRLIHRLEPRINHSDTGEGEKRLEWHRWGRRGRVNYVNQGEGRQTLRGKRETVVAESKAPLLLESENGHMSNQPLQPIPFQTCLANYAQVQLTPTGRHIAVCLDRPLSALDETRENANVVCAVCIGLLLLGLKVPKFVLHVLATEDYVAHDPAVFSLINQLLDVIFSACKPIVCLFVAAHFRKALQFFNTGLF